MKMKALREAIAPYLTKLASESKNSNTIPKAQVVVDGVVGKARQQRGGKEGGKD